jgi:hypothetical protein
MRRDGRKRVGGMTRGTQSRPSDLQKVAIARMTAGRLAIKRKNFEISEWRSHYFYKDTIKSGLSPK